jgi:hypothetical protein
MGWAPLPCPGLVAGFTSACQSGARNAERPSRGAPLSWSVFYGLVPNVTGWKKSTALSEGIPDPKL